MLADLVGHLVVYLQVGCTNEVLAAGCSVILNVGKHILHCTRDNAPLGAMLSALHGVCLPCACLPIGNDGCIVALQAQALLTRVSMVGIVKHLQICKTLRKASRSSCAP